jgi:DNA-binding PadR family transcriptional regulator
MLNSAKEAQWDELFSLEKHRDGLIKKYFVDTLLKDETLAESVRQVLKKDQQIQNKVRQERNRLAQELKKVTQGKNAVKSYADAG